MYFTSVIDDWMTCACTREHMCFMWIKWSDSFWNF